MSEYTIDKFTYNGNTYNLAGGGGSTIGFVDANSSLSDVISTCQNNDFVFYATSDTSYLPLLYYGAESGDEYAGFGIIAPINDPGKYGETAGELYYIDVNSDGWVQSESFLYESVGYVYYGETTYSDALNIIDKHDITYCVYTTGTSPNTITYYYPLTYFDDGYDTIGFSLPVSSSPDVNKIEIKELSLNSDNYWGTGTRTCVSNIKQTFYGTCATIASTATKVVTCAGFSLNSGTIIGIRFRFGNTTNAPKLNVNSTGEKDILIGDTFVGSSNVLKWSDYAVIYFMYDGTYFKYMCSVASSSQEQPRGANTWYGTSSTTASTTAKTSTIANYVLTQGAVVNITFTTGNTADALTLNVNSTGAKAIYYNNAVTSSSNKLIWDANETLTFVYTGSYYYFLSKSGLPDIPDVSGKIDTAGTGLSKSGTTLNHSNSVTAKTTQAVYPIKIDAQGHISDYGSAVTIPSDNGRVFYGTCSTGSNTAAKVVTCPDYDAYTDGDIVIVHFNYHNSATNPTLNVNGKGAKAIYRKTNGSWVQWEGTKDDDETTVFVYEDGLFTALVDTDTDTKNTAGSTNSTNKIYLIGAESQAANPQTYSNENLYFNKGLTSIAPVNSNNVASSIAQTQTGILLSVVDHNNAYDSALNMGNNSILIGVDNYNKSYSLSVNTSGDISAECLEFKIELDSTSDATLISDISDLGWTNDVIA